MPTPVTPDQAVRDWYATQANWEPHEPHAADLDNSLVAPEISLTKCVLNLGCFYPNTELLFAHNTYKWISIDFTPEVIERCRNDFPELHNYVDFYCMTMKNLPWGNFVFDLVLDLSSGDHLLLDDYKQTLKEVKRVLIKHGTFIVVYANLDHFPDGQTDVYGQWGFERRTSSKDMRAMLENTGFTIVREESNSSRSGMVCRG